MTREKSGIAQDPEGAVMATDLEPQPGQTQAHLAPQRKGSPLSLACRIWVLPTSCTDAAPPLPAQPRPPSAPDTRNLFKLCCKCNKPGPVSPLTRAGICPTLLFPHPSWNQTPWWIGKACVSCSFFPLGSRIMNPRNCGTRFWVPLS